MTDPTQPKISPPEQARISLIGSLAGVARVPFLILTPLCVLQGVFLAMAGPIEVSFLRLALVMVAALAALCFFCLRPG